MIYITVQKYKSEWSFEASMTDYRAYMKRLHVSLGLSKAPDGIQEESWWNIVMKELDIISRECSKELQRETGQPYYKPDRNLAYEEAPPMRLLALTVVLSAWIGWVMTEKQGHPYSWNKIEEAYNYGRQLSIDNQVP